MNFTIKAAAKVAEEWSQSYEKSDMKKEGLQHLKTRLWNSLKKKWERKVKDGRYIWSIDRQLVSKEDTFLWQSSVDLKGETESEIIVAQDRALQTKYRANVYIYIYIYYKQKQIANAEMSTINMRQ